MQIEGRQPDASGASTTREAVLDSMPGYTWEGEGEGGSRTGVVPLREHIARLSRLSEWLSHQPLMEQLAGVAHNLRMARAVVSIRADDALDEAASYCSSAAAYDDATDAYTAVYVALVISTTFTWQAWEGIVEMSDSDSRSRGVAGRELASLFNGERISGLREILFCTTPALGNHIDYGSSGMKTALRYGSHPAIAAEIARQFRNALIHGDVLRPEPPGWDWDGRAEDMLVGLRAMIRLMLFLVQLGIQEMVDDVELRSSDFHDEFRDPDMVPCRLHLLSGHLMTTDDQSVFCFPNTF